MLLVNRSRWRGPRRALCLGFASEVKASWSTIVSIVTTQCLGTLCAYLAGGPLPYEATNVDLLYRHSITLLCLTFLSFPANTFFGVILAIYNAVLITGLLGWIHIRDLQVSYKQMLTHGISILGVMGLRMFLGYIFGRGTGYAYPLLFFNDAIHETTCGLSMIILYCISRRAYQPSTDEKTNTFKLLSISLLLWSPNVLHGPVFFWAFSVASITGIQGLLSLLFEARELVWAGSRRASAFPKSSQLARFLSMLRTFFFLSIVFIIISWLHYLAYIYDHDLHTQRASSLPEPVLTDFLILSYPRRDDSMLLSSTLRSYTHNLGSRFHATVYTTMTPETHLAFGTAKRSFMGSPGLNFFPDPNPTPLPVSRLIVPGFLPGKQTLDLYSALSWAERNIKANVTRYLGIMEDDFEWCPSGWDEMNALLYEVYLQELTSSERGFCGIFVATGGSGLLVRPSLIPLLRSALQTYAFDYNTDIILQDCLSGTLPLCAECKLSASRRLLFRHTGASQSTYKGRSYPEDRWQCGWRQPFNGKLGIWVP